MGPLTVFLRALEGVPAAEALAGRWAKVLEKQQDGAQKYMRKYWQALRKGDSADAFGAGVAQPAAWDPVLGSFNAHYNHFQLLPAASSEALENPAEFDPGTDLYGTDDLIDQFGLDQVTNSGAGRLSGSLLMTVEAIVMLLAFFVLLGIRDINVGDGKAPEFALNIADAIGSCEPR